MALVANTQYTLGTSEGKASVASAIPAAVAATEVGISVGSAVPVTSPQQIVGRIIECLDQALSAIASGTVPATVHMALTDVTATVNGTPGTDDITLKIGGTAAKFSHQVDRTTRAIMDAMVELAKS